MDSSANLSEAFEWYFVDKFDGNKVKGPVSERDLDVMWQTRLIDSMTLVWQTGMPNWMTINNTEDLRNNIAAANMIGVFDSQTTKPAVPSAQTNKPTKPTLPNVPTTNTAADKNQKPPSLVQPYPDILAGRTAQEITNLQQIQHLAKEVVKVDDNNDDDDNEEEDLNLVGEDMIESLVMSIGQEEAGEEGKHNEKGMDIFGDKNLDKRKSHLARTNQHKDVDYSKMTPEEIKKIERRKRKTKKQQEKKKQKWYEPRVNTNIYVRGLPSDIEKEEVIEFFGKAGVFRTDPVSGEEKIKVYRDDQGNIKGDALISYFKPESVDIAMELLHEREIKPGHAITIEPAHFQQKGDYVPRKQIKIDNVTKIKLENEQSRLLSWGDDGDTKTEGLKIVIIQNMFGLEEAAEDENFITDLQQDILAECEEKVGPVQRVEVFEHNPLGIVQVKFKNATSAEACIELMNNRFFAGRQLTCFYWDGITDYKRVRETEEEEKKRIESFGQWLEGQMGSKEEEAAKAEDHEQPQLGE